MAYFLRKEVYNLVLRIRSCKVQAQFSPTEIQALLVPPLREASLQVHRKTSDKWSPTSAHLLAVFSSINNSSSRHSSEARAPLFNRPLCLTPRRIRKANLNHSNSHSNTRRWANLEHPRLT